MSLSQQIAKHLREAYAGGNWTAVSLKDALEGVSWQQAVTKVHGLNTIAALVFHINYYVGILLKVLQGGAFEGNDKYSFDLPPITSDDDWKKLTAKAFNEAELLARQVELIEDNKFFEEIHPKYGNYYRNIVGNIEHTYYHAGQVSLIKKILNEIKVGN